MMTLEDIEANIEQIDQEIADFESLEAEIEEHENMAGDDGDFEQLDLERGDSSESIEIQLSEEDPQGDVDNLNHVH